MSTRSKPTTIEPRLLAGLLVWFCATGLHALSLQTSLSREVIATSLMSSGLWRNVVESLGGSITVVPSGQTVAQVGLAPILAIDAVVSLAAAVFGAWWISKRRSVSYLGALADWTRFGWLWWLIAGVWEVGQWFLPGDAVRFLAATPQLWHAATMAGWMATFFALSGRDNSEADPQIRDNYRVPLPLCIAISVYVVVFVVLNWQLYNGLWVPHGDSAMYEEHLWNLTHGKGFRSYLDQGLFLGEHIQVVHLLLIPLHWAWPDHRLLELCESVALAAAALPVFWIAQRHTASTKAAVLLACAYLLYVPMHFLDIAIDLKTFRPTSFGVPLLLFAIDQWERGRLWSMSVLLVLTLSAKEEYAIVMACLGVWIALGGRQNPSDKLSSPTVKQRGFGAGLTICAVVYLLLAVLVIIPWFRSGDEVHYSRYFPELGNSPTEIVWNAITQPGLLMGILFRGQSLYYALALLLPLGFLPLRSPGRLAVAAPLFGMLCLLEFDGPVVPLHHFHAPIVPILVWSAAAGLGRVFAAGRGSPVDTKPSRRKRENASKFPSWASHFVWTSALATAMLYSLSPIGLPFWDTHSRYYWRNLYVSGKRAELFGQVFELVPQDSRVASTDFLHPRFTHHERSYDYSNYKRKVSNYELRVPDDTEYIVIDTRHPYSEIHSPDDVRELKQNPEGWELLPVETEGYFIVLRRRDN